MGGFASQGLLAMTQGIAGATKGLANTATLHAKNEITKEQNAETARMAQEKLRMSARFESNAADLKRVRDLDAAGELAKDKRSELFQKDVLDKENLLLGHGYKMVEEKEQYKTVLEQERIRAKERKRETETKAATAAETAKIRRAELEVK
jgi:hypothetical protein